MNIGDYVKIYNDHISFMDEETKEKHKEENIVKIERDLELGCLNIYFEKKEWKEWYRYFPDGTWG